VGPLLIGYAMPIVTCSPFDAECQKYEKVWREVEAYRQWSPGEDLLGPFLALTGARPGQRIVDVGCGTGRAALTLTGLLLHVTLVDATPTALDPEVHWHVDKQDLPVDFFFRGMCLWRDWVPLLQVAHDFSYCCDVLEHIPQEFTMLVVERCLSAAPLAFFSICFDADGFGQTIGVPLHLTVKDFEWWRDRLGELGQLIEARDLLGRGIFLLRRR
jgi:SAM-dependent methyltransferase